MNYTLQYKKFLLNNGKVSRSKIRPRNIYSIRTYEEGHPPTKVGKDERIIFVIGKVKDTIHCITLNEVRPLYFIKFLEKIRDKRKPILDDQPLEEIIKKFTLNGKTLFESYIKKNKRIYLEKNSNYRTYKLTKITVCNEMRIETDMLRDVFREGSTDSTIRADIKTELNEQDSNN